MSAEFLPYYERELLFIRKRASEFAERYPERAAALKLTHTGCDDPHVERMIEAFALIAGRIQRKIDDEFPEITQALLELLYPHLVRQVPSMGIAQFEVDAEQVKSATGHVVPRGSIAYSEPVAGVQCRFRTAYPVRLFPIHVSSASFSHAANVPGGVSGTNARYAVRIELRTRGTAKFSGLQIRDLRFHLGGDLQAAHWLYELLLTKTSQILLRCQDKSGKWYSVALGAGSIREVGFNREEAILPYAETSFQGYRLLQEYFSFPQKFLFFDLTQLDKITPFVAYQDRVLDCAGRTRNSRGRGLFGQPRHFGCAIFRNAKRISTVLFIPPWRAFECGSILACHAPTVGASWRFRHRCLLVTG